MALKINKPKLSEEQIATLRAIGDEVEVMKANGTISDSTYKIIMNVSSGEAIPNDIDLYISYRAFMCFAINSPEAFDTNNGYVPKHNDKYTDIAICLTDKPRDVSPINPYATVRSNGDRKGIVVINPVCNIYNFVNLRPNFEPLRQDYITPAVFATKNKHTKIKDWYNFPVLVNSKEGIELYIPRYELYKWMEASPNGGVCFHFNKKPDNVERFTKLITHNIVRMIDYNFSIKNTCITHGIMPYNHEIECIHAEVLGDTGGRMIFKISTFSAY